MKCRYFFFDLYRPAALKIAFTLASSTSRKAENSLWPMGATVKPFFLPRSMNAFDFAAFVIASASFALTASGVPFGTDKPRKKTISMS